MLISAWPISANPISSAPLTGGHGSLHVGGLAGRDWYYQFEKERHLHNQHWALMRLGQLAGRLSLEQRLFESYVNRRDIADQEDVLDIVLET
jgi:hypothetical protein